MSTTGVVESLLRKSAASASVLARVVPAPSARSPAAWIAGPSAKEAAEGAGGESRAGGPDPHRGTARRAGKSQIRKGSPWRIRERASWLLRRPGHVLRRHHEGRRTHLSANLRRHLLEGRLRQTL